jgi:hypothetical protein
MPYRRRQSEMVTWHSQLIFLLIALFWGLSYLMPPHGRIPFSEVFPDTIERGVAKGMWIWGLLLFTPALVGFIGDMFLRFTSWIWSWHMALWAHFLLTATYASLTACALWEGMEQVTRFPWPWTVSATISALSRPLLWGGITYVHWTYARLPAPAKPAPVTEKEREWPTPSSTH